MCFKILKPIFYRKSLSKKITQRSCQWGYTEKLLKKTRNKTFHEKSFPKKNYPKDTINGGTQER